MRLIGLAVVLTLSLTLAPFTVEAQQTGKVRRIGVLMHDGAPPGLLEAFREGLRELDYVEGKNITIESQNAEGKNEQLSALADELVRLKVEVILAVNTPSAHAAKKATQTIPIVITRVSDPEGSGLVSNLARPGGNVTGMSILPRGLAAKRTQFLREIVPGILVEHGLFDHVVGAEQHRRWNREPQRPGGLEVDDEVELRRFLTRPAPESSARLRRVLHALV